VLNLPVPWMALVIFAATYLVTSGIYWVVTRFAVDDRAHAFKGVSPGVVLPLGIIFGLPVGFMRLRSGVISIGRRSPSRPKPAHFVLSFYSPEPSRESSRHALLTETPWRRQLIDS
jgi:hypothetical protein